MAHERREYQLTLEVGLCIHEDGSLHSICWGRRALLAPVHELPGCSMSLDRIGPWAGIQACCSPCSGKQLSSQQFAAMLVYHWYRDLHNMCTQSAALCLRLECMLSNAQVLSDVPVQDMCSKQIVRNLKLVEVIVPYQNMHSIRAGLQL